MRRLGLVALLSAALAAPAAAAGGKASLALSVAPRAEHADELVLTARVDGAAAGRKVDFFVVSTEFKDPRNVPVGSAATGKDGLAVVRYAPTWSGEETFVARLAGAADAHPPTAKASYRVTTSAPGALYAGANPGRPLAAVGGVFLDTILGLVAFVWLSLAVMLGLAFGWIPRLARQAAR